VSCSEFAPLLDLYAFGALEGAEREAVTAHLRGGCADCRREAARARRDLALFALAAPPARPSPRVRERLLASLPGAKGASRRTLLAPAWIAVAAAAALLVTTLVAFSLFYSSRTELARLGAELERRTDALAARELDIEFLTNLATRVVPLLETTDGSGQKERIAYVFVDPVSGRTVLYDDRLPPLASGRAYQLWYLNVANAPVSGGTFDRDAAVRGYRHRGPAGLPSNAALALTDEPAGGSPGPTTTPFAVGTL
jgi:anti-sigma-K factor RskA